MHDVNINQARQIIYNLLGLCFIEEHAKNQQPALINELEKLSQNSFDPDVSLSAQLIVTAMKRDSELLYNEYQSLFLVPFGQYVPLSASWYFEEREGGAMLVNMRSFLAKTTIRRDEKAFQAPEDHYGFIFTFMSYFLKEEAKDKGLKGMNREVFVSIINPYCDFLAEKLMNSTSEVYKNVGVILSNFCEFERAYLEVIKPRKR